MFLFDFKDESISENEKKIRKTIRELKEEEAIRERMNLFDLIRYNLVDLDDESDQSFITRVNISRVDNVSLTHDYDDVDDLENREEQKKS